MYAAGHSMGLISLKIRTVVGQDLGGVVYTADGSGCSSAFVVYAVGHGWMVTTLIN